MLVYPEFDMHIHVTDQMSSHVVETRYGADLGVLAGAIVALQRDEGNVWTAVDERITFGAHRLEEKMRLWIRLAQELRDLYGDGIFYCDAFGPTPAHAFRQAGIPVKVADVHQMDGIQTMHRLLHPMGGSPGLLIHSRCLVTIEQLLSYSFDPEAPRSKQRPLKKDDHTCDALRFALHTPRHQPASW